MPELRVAIAQTNPTVGFISGNLQRLLELAQHAWDQGAEVLLTGELALSGYPIEDLALRTIFSTVAVNRLIGLPPSLSPGGLATWWCFLATQTARFLPRRTNTTRPTRSKHTTL